jgi:hypothetical protein
MGKESKQVATAASAMDKAATLDYSRDETTRCMFVPFSIEGWKTRSGREQLMKHLATEAASTWVWDRDVFSFWTRKEMSLSLIIGNAKIVLRYVGCLIRGVRQQCHQGEATYARNN